MLKGENEDIISNLLLILYQIALRNTNISLIPLP